LARWRALKIISDEPAMSVLNARRACQKPENPFGMHCVRRAGFARKINDLLATSPEMEIGGYRTEKPLPNRHIKQGHRRARRQRSRQLDCKEGQACASDLGVLIRSESGSPMAPGGHTGGLGRAGRDCAASRALRNSSRVITKRSPKRSRRP